MTPLASAATTAPAVTLTPGTLRICDLAVGGAALDAAREAADLELCVRRMLEIGGSVLLAGPYSSLLDQVDGRVARLIDALDTRADGLARLRAVTDASASKGVAFEDLVAPVLERCFAPFGDVVEDTSRTPGADGRSKHGDFTVTVAATDQSSPRRIVVEVKDRPTLKLGGPDGALAALDHARNNRDAAVGILVCSAATPALEAQRLRLYGDSRLLVLLDKDDPDPLALEVACQVARTLAMAGGPGESEVDAPLVAESVARLREILDAASDIRKGCQEASRGVKRISAAYDEMRERADEAINRLAAKGG